jgi:hypothetical protein
VCKNRIAGFLRLPVFTILFCAALCLFTRCSSAGALVSDIGIGVEEYRRIQTEQRKGETELAVTGAKLEYESRETRSELSELERSISASQRAEPEIGNIIQRIRERELDPDFIKEWKNRGIEAGSGE